MLSFGHGAPRGSTAMDQYALVVFLFWPLVVIACALLNMLAQWSLSWSELILDYFAGVVIGLCFWYGTPTRLPVSL
jgi:hypothetical protein